MWSAKPVAKSRAPAAAPTFEHHLDAKRKCLRKERAGAAELEARAVALRAEAAAAGDARHLVRRRADLEREAAALERRAAVLRSGFEEFLFERTAERYRGEYEREPRYAPARADPPEGGAPLITAPGVSQRHTAASYSHATALRDTHRQEVATEFIGETGGAPPPIAARPRDSCPLCAEDLLLHSAKSILVCPSCGYTLCHLDATAANMSYSDDYEMTTFSYKRISHFEDCLKQIQGKESYVVPDADMQLIMQELHSQRVSDLDQITPALIRDVVKRLRLRKAYDHVIQIVSRLTGRKPQRMSAEAEDRCRAMFMRMNPAFDRNCPHDRKNFLSYNYVLFRCLHLLGLHSMLPSIDLLKGKEKLLFADQIFARICADLGWTYVPIETIPGAA